MKKPDDLNFGKAVKKTWSACALSLAHVGHLGPRLVEADELGGIVGVGAERTVFVDEAVEAAAARPTVEPEHNRRRVRIDLGLNEPVVKRLVPSGERLNLVGRRIGGGEAEERSGGQDQHFPDKMIHRTMGVNMLRETDGTPDNGETHAWTQVRAALRPLIYLESA
eukprot:5975013-Prymnesium_polylepis.1